MNITRLISHLLVLYLFVRACAYMYGQKSGIAAMQTSNIRAYLQVIK